MQEDKKSMMHGADRFSDVPGFCYSAVGSERFARMLVRFENGRRFAANLTSNALSALARGQAWPLQNTGKAWPADTL
jgi:hypothetical protein